MGREIKRVPLDFDQPVDKIWDGYRNPFCQYAHDCPECGGGGYNPATAAIYRAYYDFEQTGAQWCHSITQDEVDALIAEGQLRDFTHTWTSEDGSQPRDPMPAVTAEEVNKWSRVGFGHDAINCMILVETRAKRLGVFGLCEHCKGKGDLWEPPEMEKSAEDWMATEPPEGPGWQVWETVSEGSPITPVFETSEDLVDHLVNVGCWHQKYSRGAARAFVETGWVPSMMVGGGKLHKDIDSAPLLVESSEKTDATR